MYSHKQMNKCNDFFNKNEKSDLTNIFDVTLGNTMRNTNFDLNESTLTEKIWTLNREV